MTLQEAINNVNNALYIEPKKEKVSVSYNCPKLKTGSNIVDVRAIVTEYSCDGKVISKSKSQSIIKVDLRKVTKIPSEVELESECSTQYFKDNADIMSLQQREYQKIKMYCRAAIDANNAERTAKLRGRATIFGDTEIHQCALSIHELCEWIEAIEHTDELRADEAQDIQQATVRLESILEKLGYEKKSFNTEMYENDKIAQKLDKKYDVHARSARAGAGKTKAQKENEIAEHRAPRMMNCDESLLVPLSESATTNTVSHTRQAFEATKGRPVKPGKKKD
ncbi:hypothetical protein [Vibrio cyclitrophicus]|uniref:hypothetical protein n=1 Tax=Vibrio cyclitrophicus TaxID=47951 RepID=UPI001055DC1D|nr:hypothetical protein [Vibrio cyclitrophicus]